MRQIHRGHFRQRSPDFARIDTRILAGLGGIGAVLLILSTSSVSASTDHNSRVDGPAALAVAKAS